LRSGFLDNLRGVAVIWMVIFHASYDLRMFHFLDWDFNQGFWFAFPRVIAFTFLFCVGISLNYTHSGKVNLQALKKRTIKLGGAALVVSTGTYLLFPGQWIFFGTLHCILFGSLLGAPLVNRRKIAWPLLVIIFSLQYVFDFDIKWVSSIIQKPSMDFIPIYPWFWVILLGILTGPSLSRIPVFNRMKPLSFFAFLGQHSLLIYLVHQPVIFGLVWAMTFLRL
jgi:uncharacterized membrane protein